MSLVRPYKNGDAEKLLQFLQKFNPLISDARWRTLFEYSWDSPLDYRGMILEDEGEVKGCLSYINSKVNGRNFTNISSWVVLPAYRSKSLQLLKPLFKHTGLIITNLSPHPDTHGLFDGLGFTRFAQYEYRVNPYKAFFLLKGDKPKLVVTKITQENANSLCVDNKTIQIIADHISFKNIVFYHIANKVISKNFVVAFNRKSDFPKAGFKQSAMEALYRMIGRNAQYELFYCSSSEFVSQNFQSFILAICKIPDVRSLNISEHFVNSQSFHTSYPQKSLKQTPMFCYSETPISDSEISFLYSEKVLLNF
jgi:hypothetical protein